MITRVLTRRTVLIFAAMLFAGGQTMAAEPPVYQDGAKGAASGFDVVAYFTEGRPVEGSDAFTAAYNGATWHFSSAAHRDLFVANPEKYAPQYGGYCAYAVSQGATATTVPEAWSIVGGKLYLNYSLGVRGRWEADKLSYIAAGDKNWPRVLN